MFVHYYYYFFFLSPASKVQPNHLDNNIGRYWTYLYLFLIYFEKRKEKKAKLIEIVCFFI